MKEISAERGIIDSILAACSDLELTVGLATGLFTFQPVSSISWIFTGPALTGTVTAFKPRFTPTARDSKIQTLVILNSPLQKMSETG